MWSDPDDVENWAVSPRGAGWLFGDRVTREFNHFNSLKLIARAHQLVQEGYKFMFENQLVTVWSAPNYCYRCGNLASVLKICEDGKQEFKVYEAAVENERDKGMQRTKKTVSAQCSAVRKADNLSRETCLTLFDCSLSHPLLYPDAVQNTILHFVFIICLWLHVHRFLCNYDARQQAFPITTKHVLLLVCQPSFYCRPIVLFARVSDQLWNDFVLGQGLVLDFGSERNELYQAQVSVLHEPPSLILEMLNQALARLLKRERWEK